VAFSPEEDFALTCDGSTLILSDVGSSEALRFFDVPREIFHVALSDDGQFGLLTVQHIDAVVWEMHTDTVHSKLNYSNRFFPSFSSFVAAKFLKDGTQLLIDNTTGAIERWSGEGAARPNRWITPVGRGIRPRIFPIAEIYLNDQ